MDFDMHPTVFMNGVNWERILPPLFPRVNGTEGKYAWTPAELLLPESEHKGATQAVCDQNGFTVKLDVKHFSPEDLMVKVKGGYVVVEGKNEQKKDGPGMVTRQFNRRYRIPKEVDAMKLECAVSPDGMLVISAPLQQDENSTLPSTE
ncbi:heat shock protein beta-6 [Trichomycterus rosablanca]|uniref:heat shock protein beta-6 n=1 Tax=Trichomycterus rosablanca TaxID=2290929 RepID=UPI002F35D8B5